MSRFLVHLMRFAALALLVLPDSLLAHEFDLPRFAGTHGCTRLTTEVALPGVEGVPETVMLRLEVAHSPGVRLSCVGPTFSMGATFYSLTELLPGLRADAAGSLPAEAGVFVLDIQFENYLWYFDMLAVQIELWVSIHPGYLPLICNDWLECPVVEIFAATLIVEPAVAIDPSTWGKIKALFD